MEVDWGPWLAMVEAVLADVARAGLDNSDCGLGNRVLIRWSGIMVVRFVWCWSAGESIWFLAVGRRFVCGDPEGRLDDVCRSNRRLGWWKGERLMPVRELWKWFGRNSAFFFHFPFLSIYLISCCSPLFAQTVFCDWICDVVQITCFLWIERFGVLPFSRLGSSRTIMFSVCFWILLYILDWILWSIYFVLFLGYGMVAPPVRDIFWFPL